MRRLTIGITLLFAAALAQAQQADGVTPAFDCWIGNAGGTYTTQFIRCIAHRDADTPVVGDDPRIEWLDEIHHELHRGSTARAERIFHEHVELNSRDAVSSIRLFTYPYEWSWAEGNPQRLVRASLCSPAADCRVSIRPD